MYSSVFPTINKPAPFFYEHPLAHKDVVNSAVFSPDGTSVVTASKDIARIWDVQTGKPIATLEGHISDVVSAEFSPDGTQVVTASRDNTARIWDAQTGMPIATLEGHTQVVLSAVFPPDGTRIVTAFGDGTANIWLISIPDIIKVMDNKIEDLSPEEKKKYGIEVK